MYRFLFVAAAALSLTACAPTRYEYYGENAYRGEPVRSAPAYSGAVGVGYSSGPAYYDDGYYPAYSSLFWSFNRSFVDPYAYPHFYYGVTWFPRNYYSVVYRSYRSYPGYYDPWGPRYGYLSYSPYRLSWVDHYYDWYPSYSQYPHYNHGYNHYAPRFGSARNEAERLARYSRGSRGYYQQDGESPRRWDDRADQRRDVIDRREALRGADYSSRTGRGRTDPGVSGFQERGADYGRGSSRGELGGRSAGSSGRADPGVSGFQTPGNGRGGDTGRQELSTSGRANPGVSGFQTPGNGRGADTGRQELPTSGRADPGVSGFQSPRDASTGVSQRSDPRRANSGVDSRGQLREPASSGRDGDAGIPYPYRSATGGEYSGRSSGVRTAERESSRAETVSRYPNRNAEPERIAPRGNESRQGSGYTSVPAPSTRYSAPREASTYSAPRETTSYAPPVQRQSYSAPREPERYAPAPERSSSREASTFSAPRERYSAPEPSREQAPRYTPPPREESRSDNDNAGRDGGSARDELMRGRDGESRR